MHIRPGFATIELMLGSDRRPEVRIWLAIVGAATLVLGTAYAMVQQSTRLSANDLPTTTAQSVKHDLEQGAAPGEAVPQMKTDLRRDNSVFVIITDGSRHIQASSTELDGKAPLPPVGTFDFTATHGQDHFTWQPASGVRMATEMMSYGKTPNDGFIITGHSLKPFEDRVKVYGELMLAGWLATLAWVTFWLLLPVQKIMVRRSRT